MKTNLKKSILSAAFIAAFCSICLTANSNPTFTSAASDTGKMSKMSKMDKMNTKKKKMSKMSSDKMKMKKDTSKM